MPAEKGRSRQEGLPIACRLTDEAQGERRQKLAREVFSGCKEIRELDDGYDFVFPAQSGCAERLVSFVASERECCPFFTFELIFAAEGGPISLRLRGPEGSKEFVGEELAGLVGE